MSENETTDIDQIAEALGEVFRAMQRGFQPLADAIATAFTSEVCDAIAGAARAEAAQHRTEAARLAARAAERDDGTLTGAFLGGLDRGMARDRERRADELESAADKLAAVWN